MPTIAEEITNLGLDRNDWTGITVATIADLLLERLEVILVGNQNINQAVAVLDAEGREIGTGTIMGIDYVSKTAAVKLLDGTVVTANLTDIKFIKV